MEKVLYQKLMVETEEKEDLVEMLDLELEEVLVELVE